MAPTNPRIRRLLAGSLLVIAVAACSPAASATPSAPASAGPPSIAQALIRTAPMQPDACMDALLGGTLARNAQSGLGVNNGGEQTAVEWPFRYSARLEDGRMALLDETGKVVAREGDEITVGGGFGNQFWHACAPVTVTRAAAANPITLRTRRAPADACHLALMTGSLERHPQTGLGIGTSDVGITAVQWPFGYTTRMDRGMLVLVDERGIIVAREHDRVNVGGGIGAEQGPNPIWHACGPVTVESNVGG